MTKKKGPQPQKPKNLDLEEYIKSNEKKCFRCSVTGNVRKYSFNLFRQFKVRLCSPCIQEYGGALPASQWLEQNIEFPKKLIRFKRIQEIFTYTHSKAKEEA